jgi:hypothetical protein
LNFVMTDEICELCPNPLQRQAQVYLYLLH